MKMVAKFSAAFAVLAALMIMFSAPMAISVSEAAGLAGGTQCCNKDSYSKCSGCTSNYLWVCNGNSSNTGTCYDATYCSDSSCTNKDTQGGTCSEGHQTPN